MRLLVGELQAQGKRSVIGKQGRFPAKEGGRMSEEEFDKQYEAARIRGEFAQAVKKFVTDDKTALAALQELHERTQTLTADYNCSKPLYFLSEDLCELLGEADDYYKAAGIAAEDAEFEDDDEIRARAETI